MAGNETAQTTSERLPGESFTERLARIKATEVEKKSAEYRDWFEAKQKRQRRDSLTTGFNSKVGSVETSGDESPEPADLPVRSGSRASLQSSQEAEVTAESLLERFKGGSVLPKERVSGSSKKCGKQTPPAAAKKPSIDAYVDFGNEVATEEQPVAPALLESSASKTQTTKSIGSAKKLKTTASSDARSSSDSSSEKDKPVSKRPANIAKDAKAAVGGTAKPKASATTSNARRESAYASVQAATATGKRPLTADPSTRERKMSFGTLPKIQKKTSVASPQSPDRADSVEASDNGIVTADEERPPRWYKAQAKSTTRNPDEAGVLTLLQRLQTAIAKHDVVNVRDCLQKLPFEQVNRSLVRHTRMLDSAAGLRLLFDGKSIGDRTWPYDISADAKELYNKWCRQIFETDLLRGILLADKKERRTTDRIVPGYTGKVDFHAFGDNDLSNGQWFPTQLTTVRDGAHGHTQGGISGKLGEGAYSCIMTGISGYPDEDNGDVVLYCGTDSDNGLVTKHTQMLIDSINTRNPVRLIRKSTLKSGWAPKVGYRYDGLYEVKSFDKLTVVGEPKAARHRFRLVRCPGQDPIRGTGEEERPTWKEIEEYGKHKRFSRG